MTFTMMLCPNGPVYAGEYGSLLPVSAKQRPHASPGPIPGDEPNVSCETAAVYPDADMPHAEVDNGLAEARGRV